jgi:hypothetical protein
VISRVDIERHRAITKGTVHVRVPVPVRF